STLRELCPTIRRPYLRATRRGRALGAREGRRLDAPNERAAAPPRHDPTQPIEPLAEPERGANPTVGPGRVRGSRRHPWAPQIRPVRTRRELERRLRSPAR